jgi:hypothetical protein
VPRKRFNATEKQVIADAGVGGRVQVQNVTQWHDAELTSTDIETDSWGWHTVAARILHTRGTVRAGQAWHVSPGHIRPSLAVVAVPLLH